LRGKFEGRLSHRTYHVLAPPTPPREHGRIKMLGRFPIKLHCASMERVERLISPEALIC
jgi:hypothetical protein